MLMSLLPRVRTLSLALIVSALAGFAPAAAAEPSYVALGDSFTAGPFIPVQQPPYGCLKSDHNYPHLAAPDLGQPAFHDASCSGADTSDMTNPQNVTPGPNPPQFDRLDADTQIVSVGIGGNDIGFSEIVRNCSSTSPNGTPCQDRYVVNGRDEISERINATAPKIDAVLQGIRDRSPTSRIYLVNYLPILPDSGPGCWPQVPVTEGDVPYLRAKHKELNAMLAARAAAATPPATLVDAYTAGIGHDACQPSLVRWVEPAVPASPAAPLHPNLFGMQGTAQVLVAAATAPAALWTGDHEEGALADWYAPSTGPFGDFGGGEYNSGSGDTTVSTERPRSGAYSAKMRLWGNGGTRLFRWREPRVTRDASYSVWLYIPEQIRVSGWWNLVQFKSRSTSGANDPIWIVEPRTNAEGELYPTLVWWHRTLEGPQPGQLGYRRIEPPAGTLLPVGRWFEVRARLLQSADFDGRITVHVDGQQVWDYQDVRTGYRNCTWNSWCTSNEWSVNNYGESLSPWPTIFADDAAIR
jgi:hypothetical protein